VAGLGLDVATALDGVLLAGHLVGQRLLGAPVRGDVLHLRAVGLGRIEHRVVDHPVGTDLVGLDQRDVGVDPQRAVAPGVVDAEILEHLLQLGEEGAHLLGRAEVRPGDDLHQRRAGAVVVDHRVLRAVDGAALVAEAPGVFLQVGPGDRHGAPVAPGAHVEFASPADRFLVLGDLEVLRQVRVEVVLPVEPGLLGNVGVQRLPHLHGGLDGRLVEHGQRSREAETDRAGVGVGLGVRRVGRAATEQLGVGLELDVDLQPDDRRELRGGRLCGH
jgi:hypothetical protein